MSSLLGRFLVSQSKKSIISGSHRFIRYQRVFYSFSSSFLADNKQKQVDEQKMEEKLKTNPYFAKYQDKLKAVYDQDPQAFLNTLENVKPEKIGDGIPGMEELIASQMSEHAKKPKSLNSIMKVELVADLKPDEVKSIWTTYMKEKSRLADVLTVDEFKKMKKFSKEFSTFLFPLPREQGYEFIMAQWLNNECHFTSLINYQAHGENAPSSMNVIYFDDLAATKQIVLEMAEVDAKSLKTEEAKFLIHLLKLYYVHASAEANDSKYQLLNKFNKRTADFKHMEIIDELKRDNLTLEQFVASTAP